METDKEMLDRVLKKFRSYRESIEAWKAHSLRSINQDLCRENLLDKLSNGEIYINLDWAMKFLPCKSREPQSEFFGKRGISWHITVVMKHDESVENDSSTFLEDDDVSDDSQQISEHEMTDLSGENDDKKNKSDRKKNPCFKYKVFLHVFDQCNQDSETVVTILNDVLHRVKETDPQIKKAFIRSDNAGCHHCANTLVSAKLILEKTGIAISRIDFCDPQGENGICDRCAAIIKSFIRRYLNENHNVTCASEFIEACHSYNGVRDVLALDCQIVNITRKQEVKLHRSWNVGSGLLIPWSQLNRNSNICNLTSKGIENFTHDWVQTKEKSVNQSMDVDDCEEQKEILSQKCSEQRDVYACNVEQGCTAAFVKFGNLINHILVGKHHRMIERFCLKDMVMKLYHSKLEEVESRRIISLDMDLVNTIEDEIDPLPTGWALPMRKCSTFSDKQCKYITEKFDEGVSSIKHWKPKEIVLDMEDLKLNNKFYFSANEILKESQIRSFFSRIKRERQIPALQQTPSDKASVKELTAKNFVNDEIDDDEVDSELQDEDDFDDIEIAVEEIKIFEDIYTNAKKALESSSN
ncbi:unnamed protein product [Adineta steineri]|uniref:C2H2-type domain-containing protein n=1 Tax=Adineta steineri TaxID=433720 RepID=A0A819YGE9_9BILA|nr:unnamed protein product [Adineta steineri]